MMFRRSIFAIKNIKKGEKFTEENIGCFRPKKGLGAEKFYTSIRKKIKKILQKKFINF